MKEIELDKVVLAPANTKYTVEVNEKIVMDRNTYMLYRVAKQAFEENKDATVSGDVTFTEYVMRTFIASVGERIAAEMAQMKTGHA